MCLFYAEVRILNTTRHSQDETSEMFIGEWMESRGIRNEMVIATKVRTYCSM